MGGSQDSQDERHYPFDQHAEHYIAPLELLGILIPHAKIMNARSGDSEPFALLVFGKACFLAHLCCLFVGERSLSLGLIGGFSRRFIDGRSLFDGL